MTASGGFPAWAVRMRAERKARGWDVHTMALLLRKAAGDDGGDLPDHESMVRAIRRGESGATTMLSERYRLLFSRMMGIPEAILFAPERSLGPYDGAADNEDRSSGHEGAGDPTNRRDVLRVGLAAAMGRVLGDAADAAMEFTRRAGQSVVGRGTLDHLGAMVTDIAGSYSRRPPSDLFVVARTYRQRVDQLIRSPHTLKEGRELFVYAGKLSETLAWLADDLGSPATAEAYAINCFEHADQAGHGELYAWAANVAASIAVHAKQPERALSMTQRGLAKAPADHVLRVRLSTQAARAHARLGQRAECESRFRKAEEMYGRLPARSPGRAIRPAGPGRLPSRAHLCRAGPQHRQVLPPGSGPTLDRSQHLNRSGPQAHRPACAVTQLQPAGPPYVDPLGRAPLDQAACDSATATVPARVSHSRGR
ncbi:hypothetical protein [Streptosporangium roseum]|uniref:hypothetical protein n=1 Tax=Streptosporangium roseum TaxID=2001 RepID=UPI0012DC432B|nr:hypothetical protein [Streptosporangium roseum]